jgi:hypothetical protein
VVGRLDAVDLGDVLPPPSEFGTVNADIPAHRPPWAVSQ